MFQKKQPLKGHIILRLTKFVYLYNTNNCNTKSFNTMGKRADYIQSIEIEAL